MINEIKKKFDLRLFLPALFLTIAGLVSIYSSSIVRHDFSNFKKQLVWLALSLVIFFLVSLLDLRFLKTNSRLIFFTYLGSLFSLIGLLIFAPVVRGIRGWYQVGPFAFDPEGIVAIVLIIVLAKYFSRKHEELSLFRTIIFSGIYALLPILLVFLQPDLGSALTLVAIWFGALIFSGIKVKHFLILCLLFAVLFAFSWFFVLKDYQQQRILSFINPRIDTQGISWSVNQSKIAIGAGGLLGKGFGKGSQTQYGFLSEPKTDFIFSAIAEEFGFAGVVVLIGFLFWLLFEIMQVAFFAGSNFLRLFSSGFGFLILSQSFINTGMCLGLFPVVGIPLPFVSYGGSHLLAFYLGLGVLMSIRRT